MRGFEMAIGTQISREFNNNLTRVYVGKHITLWFSYETIVAFAVDGEGTFKSENIWSNTTAKHLKGIPYAQVLPREEFVNRLRVLEDKIDSVL